MARQAAYASRCQTSHDIYQCTLQIIRIILWRDLKRSYILKRLDHDELIQVMEVAYELRSMTHFSPESFTKSNEVIKKAQELNILLLAAISNKIDDLSEYLSELVNELTAAYELRDRKKWKETAQSILELAIRVFEPNRQTLEALEIKKGSPTNFRYPEDKRTRADILELWRVGPIVEACTAVKTSCNKLIEFAEVYHDLSKVPPVELELLLNIFASNQEEVCGHTRRLLRCLNHEAS